LGKIKGIGAKRAKKLWERGFKTPKAIATAPRKELLKIFQPVLAKSIQKAAQELVVD